MSAASEEAAAFARHLHRRSGHAAIVAVCPTERGDDGFVSIAGASPHQLVDMTITLLKILVAASAEGADCCGGCADRHARASASLAALQAIKGSVH